MPCTSWASAVSAEINEIHRPDTRARSLPSFLHKAFTAAQAFTAGTLALALVACSSTSSTTPPTPQPTGSGLASIAGTMLLRDGNPWVPHGFYQIAFEVSAMELPNQQPFWTAAQTNYTPAEYTQMRQFGADSVRLQVAQNGINPQGKNYTAAYSNLAISAIKAARAAGLAVIVSVQDEPQTGEIMPLGLPGPATQRVWQVLAPLFGQDTDVLFELFNEPYIPGASGSETIPPTPADWALWQTALNTTIATIRGLGAKNVVVADGLVHAEQLAGAPALTDPLHEILYAAHPYSLMQNDQSPAVWDFRFGNFAKTASVLISEWGTGYYCDDASGMASRDLFVYLQAHGIGMEVGAWDWSPLGFGSAMEGFPNNQITSYPPAGTSPCNASGVPKTLVGPGKLIQTWYQTGTPSTTVE